MGFSQAPALPYHNLGIVQDGDTASQAIEKDKYVIWKGKNYFAKTDILQGETFVEDTNLTEVTEGAINGLAEALNASLNSKVTGLTSSYGNITVNGCYKIGHVCCVSLKIAITTTVPSWTDFVSGLPPAIGESAIFAQNMTYADSVASTCYIDSNGRISRTSAHSISSGSTYNLLGVYAIAES